MLHVAIQLSSTLNLKSSPSLPSAGESTKCYPHSTSSPKTAKTTLFSAKAAASIRRTQIPAATCGHAFCLVGISQPSTRRLGKVRKKPISWSNFHIFHEQKPSKTHRKVNSLSQEFHVHRIERVISHDQPAELTRNTNMTVTKRGS